MKNIKSIALAAALVIAGAATAQYSETNNLFYHSFRMPQSNMLNPAFFPNRNSVYLQLPGASISFGSPLGIGDVFTVKTQADGSKLTVVDFNNMVDQLNDENRFRLGIDINLVGFGFKIHHTFVTFNTQVRGNMSFGVPISLINTLRQGNTRTINGVEVPVEEMVLAGGDIFGTQLYAEASLGVGHYFKPINLTVGAHAKLLYGIINVNLDNTRVVINTYGDNFERLKLDAFYQVQAASAVGIDTTGGSFNIGIPSVSDMLKFENMNTGWAIDLGARYELGPFSFSASILDLSPGIHWNNNVYSISPANGHDTMSFSGVELNNMLSGGEMNTDTMVNAVTDFAAGLKPVYTIGGEYWYSIPTRINLAASYNFARLLRIGVLMHGQFDRGLIAKRNAPEGGFVANNTNTFRFNTTFSFGVNVFNWIELMAASSMVFDGSGTFNVMDNLVNPGVGIVLTLGTVTQFYVMADYVSSLYLVKAKAFNIRFGMNILIGRGGASRVSRN